MSSGAAYLDVSLNHTPRHMMTEMSSCSSASSTDVLDQTSSTAIRETGVQFLNDTAALGSKRLVTRTRIPRARTHHVSVTVPTDTTGTRPHKKSLFTGARHNSAGTRTHPGPPTKTVVTDTGHVSASTGTHPKSIVTVAKHDTGNTRPYMNSMVTNTRCDCSAGSRPHAKSVVTFQNVEPSNVEPASSSVACLTNGFAPAVDADTRWNGSVLHSADRGEQTYGLLLTDD